MTAILKGAPEPGTRTLFDMGKNNVPNSSGQATRTEIIQADRNEGGAQAFIVEQLPNSVVGSHFHAEHQFQIVVAGGGTLGRHAVAPLAVHYANRYTGYGPITAGPEGLSYVTLRRRADFAPPYWLPDSKDRLMPSKRLNLTSNRFDPTSSSGGASSGRTVCEVLIEPQADGVAAWMLRIAPGSEVELPHSNSRAARFVVAINGGIAVDGTVLPSLGCVYVPLDQPAPRVCSLENAADLLVLQFSEDAERPYAAN